MLRPATRFTPGSPRSASAGIQFNEEGVVTDPVKRFFGGAVMPPGRYAVRYEASANFWLTNLGTNDGWAGSPGDGTPIDIVLIADDGTINTFLAHANSNGSVKATQALAAAESLRTRQEAVVDTTAYGTGWSIGLSCANDYLSQPTQPETFSIRRLL